MKPRSDVRELVQVAASSVAVAGYVYVIGWLVTWGRLAAARLPVDASLPAIDERVQRALDSYYEVAGPRSPLWQAENGHLKDDGSPARDTGVCANNSGPATEELAAIRGGV